MKAHELAELVKSGQRPVFEILPGADNHDAFGESCLEPGMIVRVTQAMYEQDGVVVLSFDQSEFESHNDRFDTRRYYKNGAPTLTAREAGYHRLVERGHFDGDDDLSTMIKTATQVPSSALQAEFSASGAQGNYMLWLEAQLLASREQLRQAQAVAVSDTQVPKSLIETIEHYGDSSLRGSSSSGVVFSNVVKELRQWSRVLSGDDAQRARDDEMAFSDAFGIGFAVVGRDHLGNPIPPRWYTASREIVDRKQYPIPGAEAALSAIEQYVQFRRENDLHQRSAETIQPVVEALQQWGATHKLDAIAQDDLDVQAVGLRHFGGDLPKGWDSAVAELLHLQREWLDQLAGSDVLPEAAGQDALMPMPG